MAQEVEIILCGRSHISMESSSPSWINFNTAWISNYMSSKVRDGITYPFPNFNGCAIEVLGWLINFIPHRCTSSLNSSLQWRHNERDGVSNHQPDDCLRKRVFRRRTKKTSKLRVTSLCAGNSPVAGEFPPQRTSNAENVCIWWLHHVVTEWRHYSVRHFGQHRCTAMTCL